MRKLIDRLFHNYIYKIVIFIEELFFNYIHGAQKRVYSIFKEKNNPLKVSKLLLYIVFLEALSGFEKN